jgi:ADP-ribosyl-[dinitrogen reductase] hydrolase
MVMAYAVEDMVGGGPFGLESGECADDTSMALCLAESLVDKGGFGPADPLKSTSGVSRRPHEQPGECFDIGKATHEALDSSMPDQPNGATQLQPGAYPK